jgi:serine/threonine protein kinase
LSAVDDFLRNVLKSGLLKRDELQNTLRTLPLDKREDVTAISDHLVAAHKLTRFQLHKILQGITVGLVLGPYHLLVPLGRGGMGTVYLARDSRSQEYVALKILPPKLARTKERLLARFQREMEVSQKVKHPHLARALDVGIFQNIHYIAMEFIPGRTLYRLVASDGPLAVPRTAHLFAEVASALAQAHRQGVIHRDLKPSNLMVTPHDHAKVLDLGLAFTEGEEVEDREVVGGKGYIVGSIDYMAPEQTRDPTNIDARADLYALGGCMYFALTGSPLFPEGTVYEKVRAHRHETPKRSPTSCSGCSPSVRKIAMARRSSWRMPWNPGAVTKYSRSINRGTRSMNAPCKPSSRHGFHSSPPRKPRRRSKTRCCFASTPTRSRRPPNRCPGRSFARQSACRRISGCSAWSARGW